MDLNEDAVPTAQGPAHWKTFIDYGHHLRACADRPSSFGLPDDQKALHFHVSIFLVSNTPCAPVRVRAWCVLAFADQVTTPRKFWAGRGVRLDVTPRARAARARHVRIGVARSRSFLGTGARVARDNWAEYLVRAIRQQDARAVALFSYWPDNPYDVIRRVIVHVFYF